MGVHGISAGDAPNSEETNSACSLPIPPSNVSSLPNKDKSQCNRFVNLLENENKSDGNTDPPQLTEAAEATILSVVAGLADACYGFVKYSKNLIANPKNDSSKESWRPSGDHEELATGHTEEDDALLINTGKLHTLLLGPDMKIKSFIILALLEDRKHERDSPESLDINSAGSTIDSLMNVLKECVDGILAAAILALVHQILSPTNEDVLRERVCCALTEMHCVEVTVQCLIRVQQHQGLTGVDACTLPAYQVMTKLAAKDERLLVRFRLAGGLTLTHDILQRRLPPSNAPSLPVLMLLKVIAKNSGNQQQLGRIGCISTVVKFLLCTSLVQVTKIKYLLEILSLLTITKSNASRAVREGAVAAVVRALSKWPSLETKVLPKLMRPGVAILSHISDSKKGCRVVEEDGGITLLQQFVFNAPQLKSLDSVVCSAASVCLKCSTTAATLLPGTSCFGHTTAPALTFNLPSVSSDQLPVSSDVNVLDGRQTLLTSSMQTGKDQVPVLQMVDSDDEDVDDEVDVLDDDELKKRQESSALAGDEDDSDLCQESEKTTMNELTPYGRFFSEFMEREDLKAAEEEVDQWSGRNVRSKGISRLDAVAKLATATRTISSFIKIAYPDMIGAISPLRMEPLGQKEQKLNRARAIQSLQRIADGGSTAQHKMVYDFDALIQAQNARQLITRSSRTRKSLSNWDEKRVGRRDVSSRHLNFESRFEGGNLRKAIQVGEREYDLLLNTDVSSTHHHQWFYFEVSNMDAKTSYTFSVINNEKPNSEFNTGMQPVLFSVKEAMLGRPHWIRAGTNVSYFRNHYKRAPKPGTVPPPSACGSKKTQWYHTATFTLSFPHAFDVCYVAYHYPYSYTQLKRYICSLHDEHRHKKDVFFRCQTLCRTLAGNAVPLITITEQRDDESSDLLGGEATTDCSLLKASTPSDLFCDSPSNNTSSVVNSNAPCHSVNVQTISSKHSSTLCKGNSCDHLSCSSHRNVSVNNSVSCAVDSKNKKSQSNRKMSSDIDDLDFWSGVKCSPLGVGARGSDAVRFSNNRSSAVVTSSHDGDWRISTRPLSSYSLDVTYNDIFGCKTIENEKQTRDVEEPGSCDTECEDEEDDPEADNKDGASEASSHWTPALEKVKPVVFLTARVHPGESNASWMMQGTLQFLMSDDPIAQRLRQSYVFKIVPMLNPDGVIHGNTRCGLTGEDLNRRWKAPSPILHPTIYHTKALLEYCTRILKPVDTSNLVKVFCDYHGHSRQKNLFLYGCSRQLSWCPRDALAHQDDSPLLTLLPKLCGEVIPTFSSSHCSYTVERHRETTARVAVWRQFEINCSYTLEASTAGCDQGPYKGNHLGTHQLIESGAKFCIALHEFRKQGSEVCTAPLMLPAYLHQNSSSGSEDDESVGSSDTDND